MKKQFFSLISSILFLLPFSFSQNVGIGTNSPRGKLHIKGSNDTAQLVIDAHPTQGNTPILRIRSATGNDLLHMRVDTAFNAFFGLNAGASNIAAGAGGLFNTFIGSNAGVNNVTGSNNTAVGRATLFYNNNSSDNTAVGFHSLFNNTGTYNTAVGSRALDDNGQGWYNTAVGANALRHNLKTNANTAVGYDALSTQSFADPTTLYPTYNTAVGFLALAKNNPTDISNGNNNTALGGTALYNNTNGYNNTAAGVDALYTNTIGDHNTAVGTEALKLNQTGYFNSAFGTDALKNNTNGVYNTALGVRTLTANNGNSNTAIGSDALYNNTTGSYNTAVGDLALFNCTVGSYNVAVGKNSGIDPNTGGISNTVSIGNHGWLNAASNQVFLGNGSTEWIGGWKTWSVYSDGRIKNNITEDVKGLDFIRRLRPVTYYTSLEAAYSITGNKETPDNPGKYENEKIKKSGFVAQEMEKAARESGYDFDGVHKPVDGHGLYSISYASLVVPLVKAVQEQQILIEQLTKQVEPREIQGIAGTEQNELKAIVLKQQQIIDDKQKQIDELKARLDRLERLLMK